ncbi:MAG TPA: metallophosphoesterase [Bryobacteraceae bacterium]|nr:metallophosphoesterase [Bryobacteraceae bacterium]
MKILVFSDIHGDYAALERLMEIEADHYFAAGDLTSWGRGLDRCGEIMQARAGRVHVLPGNHESAEATAALCRKYDLHHFHEQSLEAGGYHIAGLGYSSPTPFNTPGEYSEKEMGERLEKFAELKPLVLVCHCPPFGTPLDRVREGSHAGSRAVAEFVRRRQPELLFAGHIHEAAGTAARIGKTRAYSAGPKGRLVDFDKLDAV